MFLSSEGTRTERCSGRQVVGLLLLHPAQRRLIRLPLRPFHLIVDVGQRQGAVDGRDAYDVIHRSILAERPFALRLAHEVADLRTVLCDEQVVAEGFQAAEVVEPGAPIAGLGGG
jgi:hypothetical protein